MCVKMQYVYRNKYNGNKKREAEELVVRVLVSGGGTGGHIYPALALIREIKKLNPEARFLYIGTENGLESTIV
ncbi:glycosyltransferase, partial [Bacillus thuringiensis]|nr:glycosyltransferase [Bacillus thuringiensis]